MGCCQSNAYDVERDSIYKFSPPRYDGGDVNHIGVVDERSRRLLPTAPPPPQPRASTPLEGALIPGRTAANALLPARLSSDDALSAAVAASLASADNEQETRGRVSPAMAEAINASLDTAAAAEAERVADEADRSARAEQDIVDGTIAAVLAQAEVDAAVEADRAVREAPAATASGRSSPLFDGETDQMAAALAASLADGVGAAGFPSFHSSCFKAIYDTTPRKPQATPGARQRFIDVLKGLGRPGDAELLAEYTDRSNPAKMTLAQASIRLWTTHDADGKNELFRHVNRMIFLDGAAELERWMWFVRLANDLITRPTGALTSMTVWRGSSMTDGQAQRLRPGLVVRPPLYLSLSTELDVAHRFRAEHSNNEAGGGYLIKLTIPPGCRNACLVDKLSEFYAEHEVLLPPYTAVKITSVDGHEIEGEVLDNRSYYALELAGGAHAPAWPL